MTAFQAGADYGDGRREEGHGHGHSGALFDHTDPASKRIIVGYGFRPVSVTLAIFHLVKSPKKRTRLLSIKPGCRLTCYRWKGLSYQPYSPVASRAS